MIACKQVAKALERGDYQTLRPSSRFFLKMHVRLCVMCGDYNEHVMVMQDTARAFKKHEELDGSATPSAALRSEAKERILAAIRELDQHSPSSN